MLVLVEVGGTIMGVVLPRRALWRFLLKLSATMWYWKCARVSCR